MESGAGYDVDRPEKIKVLIVVLSLLTSLLLLVVLAFGFIAYHVAVKERDATIHDLNKKYMDVQAAREVENDRIYAICERAPDACKDIE